MAVDTLIALIGFVLVTTVTPGPNTMMLFSSGVNFGFRRTIPHMVGIAVGLVTLLAGIGLGLGTLFAAYPVFQLILKSAGCVYLIYLAYRIATAHVVVDDAEDTARPLTLSQAALFQWVNPKAWMISISGFAIYADASSPVASTAIITTVFFLISFPSVAAWAGFGTALRGWLAEPARLRFFNLSMGGILLLSVYPIFTA